MEDFFPFIFPERLEDETDKCYVVRVKALAQIYLDWDDPRFLYPHDKFVSFSSIV